MNHIELFAGCGGLSLGMEAAGFEMLLANELSPMAAETFAYNFLGFDASKNPSNTPDNIQWGDSSFPRNDPSRWSECPVDFLMGEPTTVYNDLLSSKGPESLRGGLIVGSILRLNKTFQRPEGKKLLSVIKGAFGEGRVDLVSGGPPCQGFSMAGLRDKNDEKNSLPYAFADFVSMVRPRMALLENVSGIIRPFSDNSGKHYASVNIARVFADQGYVPLCLHVNAKYAGAAQNRPRFIMLAFDDQLASDLIKVCDDKPVRNALIQAMGFAIAVRGVSNKVDFPHEFMAVHDLEAHISGKRPNELFNSPIFAPLSAYAGVEFTVGEAIGDLCGERAGKRDYVQRINRLMEPVVYHDDAQPPNHVMRRNSKKIQARFRLYQVVERLQASERKWAIRYLTSATTEAIESGELLGLGDCMPKSILQTLAKEQNWLLNPEGERIQITDSSALFRLLQLLHTKKHSQKALNRDKPAPAALSIPDDACHYLETMDQRTLTVREMARFQSFPDGFVFRSKETTGGIRRRFEVPQYTQVGNAVPPILGEALGKVCAALLQVGRTAIISDTPLQASQTQAEVPVALGKVR